LQEDETTLWEYWSSEQPERNPGHETTKSAWKCCGTQGDYLVSKLKYLLLERY